LEFYKHLFATAAMVVVVLVYNTKLSIASRFGKFNIKCWKCKW